MIIITVDLMKTLYSLVMWHFLQPFVFLTFILPGNLDNDHTALHIRAKMPVVTQCEYTVSYEFVCNFSLHCYSQIHPNTASLTGSLGTCSFFRQRSMVWTNPAKSVSQSCRAERHKVPMTTLCKGSQPVKACSKAVGIGKSHYICFIKDPMLESRT